MAVAPEKVVLLVEDNPDDEELTLHAFKANRIENPVVVARDGVQALDFLFAPGACSGRDLRPPPALTLLDLIGANGYVRKPVDFARFTKAIRRLGLFWLQINEPPPSAARAKA